MQIKKESQAVSGGTPTAAQLEAINAQAKGKLTKEQVYVFSVRLCDDQLDRDGERFDTAALPVLAKLFLGKTGIIDHRWSSNSQVARIFETQVVKEDAVSYVKAWAYIRRGGNADEVIADIEAGIKKEVSVGCAMGRAVCSVCGAEYGSCGHEKGQVYDGQVCCAILKEPVDAYEFSFVAVPAQRDAGVLKGLGREKQCLKELAEEFGVQAEYRALFQMSRLGQQYRKELEDGVVRLCLALDLGASAGEDGALKILWALQTSGGRCRQEATAYDSSMDCFCTEVYAVFSGEETMAGWVMPEPEPEFSVFVGNATDSAATLFTARRAVDDTVTVLDDALWNFLLEERLALEEGESPWPQEPFSITVVREGRTEIYSGCVLTSQKRTLDKTGQNQVRQGTAQAMTVRE